MERFDDKSKNVWLAEIRVIIKNIFPITINIEYLNYWHGNFIFIINIRISILNKIYIRVSLNNF